MLLTVLQAKKKPWVSITMEDEYDKWEYLSS